MEKVSKYIIFVFLSLLIPISGDNINTPTGEEYITGEDGIKRIYINVWGHVKHPGTYLVYEDIDVMTLLSVAGGPLDGADLSKIKIISQDSKTQNINLEKFLLSNKSADFNFKPYDTVNIKPTFNFYIRDNAYILNIFLQLLTLGIAINSD